MDDRIVEGTMLESRHDRNKRVIVLKVIPWQVGELYCTGYKVYLTHKDKVISIRRDTLLNNWKVYNNG